MTDTLALTILSRDATLLHKLITQHALPGLSVAQSATSPSGICPDDVSVMLADPNMAAEIVPACHNLTWCQSTWAGNTPLLRLQKTDYVLTGVKGIFGEQMREYVFAYLLHFSRNVATFVSQQQQSPPRWREAEIRPLAGQTLGVLGAGSIARALVPVAHAFGMKIIGLTRTAKHAEGFDATYTQSDINAFVSQCDAVVNLLPDTPETENIIDSQFLRQLRAGAILINAGRGHAIVDDDLIEALDDGQLSAAVLDVFREEPLPSTHPFWHHPNITITSHTAAISRPEDVVGVFIDNARRYLKGLPLNYAFAFDRGY